MTPGELNDAMRAIDGPSRKSETVNPADPTRPEGFCVVRDADGNELARCTRKNAENLLRWFGRGDKPKLGG